MIKRSTWILLVIFVALLGALFVWQKQKPALEQEKASLQMTGTAKVIEFLLNIPEDVFIQEMKVTDNEGNVVEASRQTKQGKWVLTEPSAPDSTDDQIITTAVSDLMLSMVDMTMTDFNQLGAIGLDKPNYRIMLTLSDGTNHLIEVGNQTITNEQYYLRLDGGEPKIVSKTSLDGMINLLTNPPIVPTPTGTPASQTTPSPAPELTPTVSG